MRETEQLMLGLKDTGCTDEQAARICSLQRTGDYEEMLRQMRKQRCALVEEMHLSQRRVDRMDCLIRLQQKQMKR